MAGGGGRRRDLNIIVTRGRGEVGSDGSGQDVVPHSRLYLTLLVVFFFLFFSLPASLLLHPHPHSLRTPLPSVDPHTPTCDFRMLTSDLSRFMSLPVTLLRVNANFVTLVRLQEKPRSQLVSMECACSTCLMCPRIACEEKRRRKIGPLIIKGSVK